MCFMLVCGVVQAANPGITSDLACTEAQPKWAHGGANRPTGNDRSAEVRHNYRNLCHGMDPSSIQAATGLSSLCYGLMEAAASGFRGSRDAYPALATQPQTGGALDSASDLPGGAAHSLLLKSVLQLGVAMDGGGASQPGAVALATEVLDGCVKARQRSLRSWSQA